MCRGLKGTVLLLYFLSCALLFGGRNTIAQTANFEQQTALLLLKGSIDRTDQLSDWTISTDACTSWTGVSCNGNGQVIGIDVQGLGITGQLPLDANLWSALSTLQNINLAQNSIGGILPPR